MMFFELAIVCSPRLVIFHIQVSKVTLSFSKLTIMFLLVFIFHYNTNSLYPI